MRLVATLILILVCIVRAYVAPDGPGALAEAQRLFAGEKYEEAAMEYWKAVIWHEQTPLDNKYDVNECFQSFIRCYMVMGRVADGLAFVAGESIKRGQAAMGRNYLQQALQVDPNNVAALKVKQEYELLDGLAGQKDAFGGNTAPNAADDPELQGKIPEQLYEVAAEHFGKKQYEDCADIFETSCERSLYKLGPACSNAVYCRAYLMDWGFNGTRFDADMQRISDITLNETREFRLGSKDGQNFVWKRATSVHPHMMLGYPIDSMLKRYATEAVAYMDEQMARISLADHVNLPPLPEGLPYTHEPRDYAAEIGANYKIRVGFVGSGFNSKAVLYLSQDMFRFFDQSQFEIHVFSFGPPDNPMFIRHGMRGVDWRKRVQSNVDFFHDMRGLKGNHIESAQYVKQQGIHILIEWDGYARQGERAQGLFALRSAPIQMLHQEFLGTSGALYVDYLFSDLIASPPETQYLYVEKLIYLPNHFFSKGHAYQKEVKQPTFEYASKKTPYEIGTGSPQENRCLAGPKAKEPSFVYCNFNKFLKNNPETVRSWIRILREVPDSILCLLENPTEGIDYLRKFIHETTGTSSNHSDPATFVPGDGDELNSRIHFIKWENNPFDHQMRSQDLCNVMLDSFPYNGHTVAQDALYAGVPIVTRSDGKDMASRVTTSANVVLDVAHMNAYGGPSQYEDIAIEIALNETRYRETRNRIIESALQRNPMHPYWDVARYVKNYEGALRAAWDRFLSGEAPDHITVEESEIVAKGTCDDEITAHPTEGNQPTRSKLLQARVTEKPDV